MLTIVQGDAIERLRELPDESVQCCVTSPPYWGLRDYSTNGQLGLEKTPEEYVAKMVEVFREVRRVLRKDGTCWINLGDAYAQSQYGSGGGWAKTRAADGGGHNLRSTFEDPGYKHGLKPKDLCGIPWRVAFALQADGWWLRSDIIWEKPNPMPESVTDRPTKAHEYLFLLTKASSYYYDAEAIKEGCDGGHARISQAEIERISTARSNGDNTSTGMGRTPKCAESGSGIKLNDSFTNAVCLPVTSRNKRSVWTVATAPYPEAHFATYPPDLIKPCIMAGTSAKGCCAKCGAPWERIVERPPIPESMFNKARFVEDGLVKMSPLHRSGKASGQKMQDWLDANPYKTLGWQPTCDCSSTDLLGNKFCKPITPCTVLDPFAGSGTTGAVALELGRKAVLIELNPKYVELIEQRCNVTVGLALAC